MTLRTLLFLGLFACGLCTLSAQTVISDMAKDAKHWRAAGVTLTHGEDGVSSLRFKGAGWSAAICTVNAPKDATGMVEVKAVLRWKSKEKSRAAIRLLAYDAKKKLIPQEGGSAKVLNLPFSEQDTPVSIKTAIPQGTASFRVDISSSGPGELEFKSFTISILPAEAAPAAAPAAPASK